MYSNDDCVLYVCAHCLVVAHRLSFKILRRHDLAEDAVRDALLKAILYAKSFDRTRNPCPWFLTIVRRISIDRLLQRQAEKEMTNFNMNTVMLREPEEQEDDSSYDLFYDDVLECIRSLSDRDQQMIHFRFMELLEWTEVAERLGIRKEAAKVAFGRAKIKIRDCIERKGSHNDATNR